MRLDQRGQRSRQCQAGAIQRVEQLRLGAGLGPVADRHAARLVVAEVADAAHLEPALDAGCPDLEVVLAGLDEAHLAGAHQQHPVRQAQALEEDLGALGEPLELLLRLAGGDEADHLDLVELVDPENPARVAARGAGLAAEGRRVGGIADRQPIRLDDLVAVQVGDRDLGGRDQVEVVAGDDVHLVLLVGNLPRAGGAGRIDDGGRPDLGHAVLAAVDVQEPVDEDALQCRSVADVDREAGAAHLGTAHQVDQAELLGELPVRPPMVARQRFAPGTNGGVRLFPAHRHVGVGRVRDPQHGVIELCLDGRELGVDRLDPLPDPRRCGLQLRNLGAGRVGTAADGLADALRRRVALGLESVALGEERATALVQLQGTVDDRGVFALVHGALAQAVRLLAQPLQADAHVAPPAASARRRCTKSGSSEATSHPARGPFGRPRNAR